MRKIIVASMKLVALLFSVMIVVSYTVSASEGPGAHIILGGGITHASGSWTNTKLPGLQVAAGVITRFASTLDFATKLEFQTTPHGTSASASYKTIALGSDLLYAPRRRGSSVSPLLVGGTGLAWAGGYTSRYRLRLVSNFGVGLKIRGAERPSLLLTLRFVTFHLNGSGTSNIAVSLALKMR
jgi:hypothetical protein